MPQKITKSPQSQNAAFFFQPQYLVFQQLSGLETGFEGIEREVGLVFGDDERR